eukprot:scaffold12489_cov145-Isochrysis_galbana.AAC.6
MSIANAHWKVGSVVGSRSRESESRGVRVARGGWSACACCGAPTSREPRSCYRISARHSHFSPRAKTAVQHIAWLMGLPPRRS